MTSSRGVCGGSAHYARDFSPAARETRISAAWRSRPRSAFEAQLHSGGSPPKRRKTMPAPTPGESGIGRAFHAKKLAGRDQFAQDFDLPRLGFGFLLSVSVSTPLDRSALIDSASKFFGSWNDRSTGRTAVRRASIAAPSRLAARP